MQDDKTGTYTESMEAQLLKALSLLAGRQVTRTEVAEATGRSPRTITRRREGIDKLTLREVQGLADHLNLTLPQVLLALHIITPTDIAQSVDEYAPLLSEATTLELAEQLVKLLRGGDATAHP